MIGLALTLMLGAAAPADPIAPGLAGQVQCYSPNMAQKTCASIGAYARTSENRFDNHAIVLVSRSPLIVMDTTTPVSVKSGAICGPMTAHDVEVAKFTVDGKPATEASAASLRKALLGGMAQFLDHEACTTYAPDGEVLKAEVSIDGQRVPAMDQKVIWVKESDGYRVAP